MPMRMIYEQEPPITPQMPKEQVLKHFKAHNNSTTTNLLQIAKK
jgi:hypothetical protein